MNSTQVPADRPLATIVRIQNILPIEGADRIVLAQINGWNCVVKKDEFNIGDYAIYFSIDSIPDFTDPNVKFLSEMGIKRIKTIKIRGQISQGLLGPLKWLEDRGYDITNLKESDNVTQQLGVTKYVQIEEMGQYANTSGKEMPEFSEKWPEYIPKTDEDRLQNNLKYLDRIIDREIVITRKEDGSSCTFVFNNGKFSVCSRNMIVIKGNQNAKPYFFLEEKFKIGEKMEKYGKNIAIQGEALGPTINSNKLKLSEYTYRIFNIYDIDKHQYLLHSEITNICAELGLEQVPLIYKGPANSFAFNKTSDELVLASQSDDQTFETLMNSENGHRLVMEKFLILADSLEYGTNIRAEGLVLKTDDQMSRIGFKVISNEFLLANDNDNKIKKSKK
jgi:RNA ligase (TIGR02306 family)